MFLRILVDSIPEQKKSAAGVRGMKLSADDELCGIYVLTEKDAPTVTVKDKEIALNRLHVGNRDTKGVKR